MIAMGSLLSAEHICSMSRIGLAASRLIVEVVVHVCNFTTRFEVVVSLIVQPIHPIYFKHYLQKLLPRSSPTFFSSLDETILIPWLRLRAVLTRVTCTPNNTAPSASWCRASLRNRVVPGSVQPRHGADSSATRVFSRAG